MTGRHRRHPLEPAAPVHRGFLRELVREGQFWNMWRLVLLAGAVLLTAISINDAGLQRTARHIAATARSTTATDARVEVAKSCGKTCSWEVDEVQVHLPEGGDRWFTLTGIRPPALPDHHPTGWQAPTGTTGYQAPFEVWSTPGDEGRVVMAAADATYWRATATPGVEALFAGGCALVLLGSLVPAGARARQSRAARTAAGSTEPGRAPYS